MRHLAWFGFLVACASHPSEPSPASDGSAARVPFVMANPMGVFTLDATGGNKSYLYSGTSGAASWTPDGRILFSIPSPPQIRIMNADGSGMRVLFDGTSYGLTFALKAQMAGGHVTFMAWPPNGTIDNGQISIWIMDADGSNPHRIIDGAYMPHLARDGTFLVYTVQSPAPGETPPYHRQVWRANIDGSAQMQLTFPDDANYPDANAAAISPDGTAIAIFSGKEEDDTCTTNCGPSTWGYRNVAIISPTGGPRRLVTSCEPVTVNPNAQCNVADNPFWSPDGSAVGWDFSSAAGLTQTWVSSTTGTDAHRLYTELRAGGNVPWH